jgi:hypothetical protein
MPSTSSGFFIQSNFGSKGNLEAVIPGRVSGLAYVWRDNDNPALPWSAPNFFDAGTYAGTALIQSNFGTPGVGNLEVVALTGGQLVHFWREDQAPFTWHGPTPIASGVSGKPALIQGNFGVKGNFELVAPLTAGAIGHFWRDNDGALDWHGPEIFGASTGQIRGVALLQSSFGPGNLEVIATTGTGSTRWLEHSWRDASGWHGPEQIFFPNAFGARPDGTPGFIQTSDGNFQVVFGGNESVRQVERSPSGSTFTWEPVDRFGEFVSTVYGDVSLIQTNYGPGEGNFEALARKSDKGPGVVHVNHFWRESADGSPWSNASGDLLD